jgi:hypothetical protein
VKGNHAHRLPLSLSVSSEGPRAAPEKLHSQVHRERGCSPDDSSRYCATANSDIGKTWPFVYRQNACIAKSMRAPLSRLGGAVNGVLWLFQ